MPNVSNIAVAAGLLFLFQSATGPLAHSEERHIILTNNTREPIIEMYVSDDDHTDKWQEDVLGAEFLLPGKSIYVDVDKDANGNCWVDIKVMLENGSSRIFRRVNSCYDGHAISAR
jgi:hypothetical protein